MSQFEGLKIINISNSNAADLNKIKSTFQVQSKLNVRMENNVIQYYFTDVESWEKSYEDEYIDINKYIDNENRQIYFAYINEDLAGQIILKTNWNNYCFIEDVRVAANYKGNGIGKQLIEVAKEWTISKGLKGITLETQNNNASACKFYEKCGFILGGFDYLFYRQIKTVKDEVVLYWYLLMD